MSATQARTPPVGDGRPLDCDAAGSRSSQKQVRRCQVTFVTVVFEAEIELLRLQAISISIHVDRDLLREIIVIDNTASGLKRRHLTALLRSYGAFAPLVRFIRPNALGKIPSTTGWRAQQALKLLVSENVGTEWYVSLDAKVHFIRATVLDSFFAKDGKPNGGIHSYSQHPLLPMLRTVLLYENLAVDDHLDNYTSTATPFLLSTATVRALVRDVGARHANGFGAEFVQSELTEFFLYTAWQLSHGCRVDELTSGQALESPTLWPRTRTPDDVRLALNHAGVSEVTTFAVHRTALAHLTAETQDLVARFWSQRGLFASPKLARQFIRSFRRSYYPAMVRKKARELGKRLA